MRWSKKWGNCQVIRRLCGSSISMKKDELEVFFSICHRVLPIEVVKTWNTNVQTHNSLRWTNKFFQRFVVQHLLDLLPSTTVSRRWSLGFHAIERSERIHSCDRPLLDVVPISSFFFLKFVRNLWEMLDTAVHMISYKIKKKRTLFWVPNLARMKAGHQRNAWYVSVTYAPVPTSRWSTYWAVAKMKSPFELLPITSL